MNAKTRLPLLFVLLLMLLSLGLHLYNLESIGNANEYYTAAVQSMLQSWHNFFFVAAEPGGSVTVDKPPLGLWVQAIFAYFLGVSGVSVSLPNILAGVFSVPLLYHLVKKYAGVLAGLIAALVMTLTPVFLATNRNNTMDGFLVFLLLLAAWAFIRATETAQTRWLLLGAVLVGLGFNVKMLQAFLPLPAFYALYFWGARAGWGRKVLQLGLATLLLVAVSLSWAVAVDLTPAENRPYIGSSEDNTVLGLILGHNGASRLGSLLGGDNPTGGNKPASTSGQSPSQPASQPAAGRTPPAQALAACQTLALGDACSFTQGNGNTISGVCITPPASNQLVCAPQSGGSLPGGGSAPAEDGGAPNRPDAGNNGGTPFSQETGSPGILRFFTSPLSKQMSWLLPFALLGTLLALFAKPVQEGMHKALLLWGGWLWICIVFFSAISGIFHAYYAIMLAPALGAAVGMGASALWGWAQQGKKWWGWLAAAGVGGTLLFQGFALWQYNAWAGWMLLLPLLFGLGVVLLLLQRKAAALGVLLASLLLIPLYWSWLTVANPADHNLPTAYSPAVSAEGGRMPNPSQPRVSSDSGLVDFLQANTQDVEYLLAVPSSQQGAELVLQTGRPVLYMGGFGGGDEVVNSQDLGAMVQNGELRFVLAGKNTQPEISAWLASSCQPVPQNLGEAGQLYRCD